MRAPQEGRREHAGRHAGAMAAHRITSTRTTVRRPRGRVRVSGSGCPGPGVRVRYHLPTHAGPDVPVRKILPGGSRAQPQAHTSRNQPIRARGCTREGDGTGHSTRGRSHHTCGQAQRPSATCHRPSAQAHMGHAPCKQRPCSRALIRRKVAPCHLVRGRGRRGSPPRRPGRWWHSQSLAAAVRCSRRCRCCACSHRPCCSLHPPCLRRP